MQIELKFKNIIEVNSYPKIVVSANDLTLYTGPVDNLNLKFDQEGSVILRITFTNKTDADTIVENGKIIRDKSFELESIRLDGYDIKELIWVSKYTANTGEEYPGCLYFGPAGYYTLEFYTPVLHWILSQRNSPGWREDYEYYTRACQLLTQISR